MTCKGVSVAPVAPGRRMVPGLFVGAGGVQLRFGHKCARLRAVAALSTVPGIVARAKRAYQAIGSRPDDSEMAFMRDYTESDLVVETSSGPAHGFLDRGVPNWRGVPYGRVEQR